ncbi:uncharacterized protein LOC130987731 [Salvia miltiorrhiza]|uniref:uncharacterized protein LOC130987731 n=1 Tax=Salvia miltiorrhiza TaxID=226208 RepID=UPI0025AC1EE2|nr:uncharacterized protein LOC130987731 [Salvia miltiorrhiza]
MANPRRPSYSSYPLPISDPIPNSIPQFQPQTPQAASTVLNSLKIFLKKPHAFPFLLSIFCLLAWVSLRLQHRHSHQPFRQSPYTVLNDKNGGYSKDSSGNLVKFSSVSSPVTKDKRGWLIDPISAALDYGVSGGAVSCASVHVGEIRPGTLRGNHRHHTCNETFVIWGAKTVLRLENKELAIGYSEVTVGTDEVAVVASPSGSAHALMNVDTIRSTFFMGCQDVVVNYNGSATDFHVWKDLS